MARKLRSVQLKSVADVNRFLAKLVNMVNRNEIDPIKATKICYVCNSLASGLRRQDLEDRISKLEAMVVENGKN